MFNLPKSQKNFDRIKKIIEVVIDEYELLDKPTSAIVVTPEKLKSIDSDKEGFMRILRFINSNGINAFNIYNDLPNSPRMGLKNNVVFKIRSANYLTELKGIFEPIKSITFPQRISLPKNWKLLEHDGKSNLLKDEKVVFTFLHDWSAKYRYFKCLWQSYGQNVEYKVLYQYETKLKYPEQRGKIWRTNSNIRNTLNKLKKKLNSKKVPIIIKINKGASLVIR